MRKEKFFLLLVINFAVLLTATVYFKSRQQKIEPLAYRFTLVYPDFWDEYGDGIPEVAKLEDASLKCVSYNSTNEDAQIEELKKAVYSRADGIITVGDSTSQELADVVNEAEDKGIPVILVDSDLPDTTRSGYVGADNRAVGEMAGEAMAKNVQEDARIAILVSSKKNSGQAERTAGFQSVADRYGKMEVIRIQECGTDRITARRQLLELLGHDSEINALYCADLVSSEMAGEILEELGRSPGEIRVVSSGMSEEIGNRIADGWYVSSVTDNAYRNARQAVSCLKDCLNGPSDERYLVYTDVVIVEQDFDYGAWTVSQEKEDGE